MKTYRLKNVVKAVRWNGPDDPIPKGCSLGHSTPAPYLFLGTSYVHPGNWVVYQNRGKHVFSMTHEEFCSVYRGKK